LSWQLDPRQLKKNALGRLSVRAIVNEPGTVIHYERAAIALEVRGKLQTKAVTGTVRINFQDPDIVRLKSLLEWASVSNSPFS
jgi:hypothetical protein